MSGFQQVLNVRFGGRQGGSEDMTSGQFGVLRFSRISGPWARTMAS